MNPSWKSNDRPGARKASAPPVRRPSGAGFTLLEIMMVVAIMGIVTGALFTLFISFGDTSSLQMDRSNAADQAQRGLMLLSAQLRNASRATVPILPAASITFKQARDNDGNGSAVDRGGNLELSPVITIIRNPANTSQLIMTEGTKTTVLANNLMPDTANDHGIWFDTLDNASIRVTLKTKAATRRGNPVINTLTEIILPRN